MNFTPLKITGSYLIEKNLLKDQRGHFTRDFCKQEYQELGLETNFVQHNSSYNESKLTLRGLHILTLSEPEVKVVHCSRGRAFDVAIDLRRDSPTFLQWQAIELSFAERNAVYIPAGCAHGFLTLEDDTELNYLTSHFYQPDAERIIKWNDTALNIKWPCEPLIISDKDKLAKSLDLNNLDNF